MESLKSDRASPLLGWLPIWGVKGMKEQQAPTGEPAWARPRSWLLAEKSNTLT